jgi:hypothetical protein
VGESRAGEVLEGQNPGSGVVIGNGHVHMGSGGVRSLDRYIPHLLCL